MEGVVLLDYTNSRVSSRAFRYAILVAVTVTAKNNWSLRTHVSIILRKLNLVVLLLILIE